MIYLCIPAHDEEQTVGVVLWKIRQVLTEFPRDYQILVADDASTDRTAEVLSPYARVLPLTVLRARERRGYAASLEMLLREACRRSSYPKRDVLVTLQADFTDEPEDIVPLIKMIEQGADIVGGTRATNTRPPLLERWMRSWQRRLLGRLDLPDNCGDPLAGFRAYRVHTVKRALEETRDARLLQWDGALADVELLRAAAPHARRVESIEVVYRPDRRQRASRASTWETLKGLRRYARGVKPSGTVPLAQLSPETLPPPRPLEIERERRDEAAATALLDRKRNGNRGRTRGATTERERRPRSTETRASGGASEGRTERPRRDRPKPGPKPQPQERKAASAGAPGPEPDVAPAVEGTDAPAPKKRRRRRKRKSRATTDAQPQSQVEAGRTDAPVAGISSDASASSDAPDAPADGSAESPAGGQEGAPKKRRRRGGRRGGRGRRRRTEGGAASPTAEGGAASEQQGNGEARPDVTEHSDAPASIGAADSGQERET